MFLCNNTWWLLDVQTLWATKNKNQLKISEVPFWSFSATYTYNELKIISHRKEYRKTISRFCLDSENHEFIIRSRMEHMQPSNLNDWEMKSRCSRLCRYTIVIIYRYEISNFKIDTHRYYYSFSISTQPHQNHGTKSSEILAKYYFEKCLIRRDHPHTRKS